MDRRRCLEADLADPLAAARTHFALPEGLIYLDGNSLGALQPVVAARLRDVVEHEWGAGLIRSWNDAGWVELPRRIAGRLAPLLGADRTELAVTDSTSANLFKALAAARRLRPDRHVLLTDDANFPTDVYVAQGLATLTGDLEVRVVHTDEVASHLVHRAIEEVGAERAPRPLARAPPNIQAPRSWLRAHTSSARTSASALRAPAICSANGADPVPPAERFDSSHLVRSSAS